MTVFVLLAVLMTAAAMGVVVLGMRGKRGADRVSRAQANAAVIGEQLRELAREHERGLIDAAGYAQARDELQRLLLADVQPGIAAAGAQAGAQLRANDGVPSGTAATREARASQLGMRAPMLLVTLAVPVLAAGLYVAFGNPAALLRGDLPAAQAAGDAQSTQSLRTQLEAHVGATPSDARAWVLLARLRLEADDFQPAADAYAKAIALSPRKVAKDAQVWAEYADAVGMAQGGTLAGKPRELIDAALALNPAHPKALELAGSAAYEVRAFRAAHAHWSALLAQLPADSPQRAQLQAALEKVERLAQFALPSS